MRGLRHPYMWGRDHPLVVDGLIAAFVVAVGVITELSAGEHPEHLRDANAFSVTGTLVGTLPLVLRRRYPVAVYLVAFIATLVLGAGEFSGAGPWSAMMFALYDGEMSWGARRGGGFQVWVQLPLTASRRNSIGAS